MLAASFTTTRLIRRSPLLFPSSRRCPCRLRDVHLSARQLQGNSNETVLNVFDRKAKLLQRERAAQADDPDKFDFLKEEVGYRLADRVLDIKRRLEVCVDLGTGRGYVPRHLSGHSVGQLSAVEMSPSYLEQCHMPHEEEV